MSISGTHTPLSSLSTDTDVKVRPLSVLFRRHVDIYELTHSDCNKTESSQILKQSFSYEYNFRLFSFFFFNKILFMK